MILESGVITDLVQIKRLGQQKRGENERLRKHMKRHVFVERRLRQLAEQIEQDIDCTQCANCCKVATVRLMDRDVERLAKFFRLSAERFVADYCDLSEEEGLILKRDDKSGCTFLDGTTCTIYEARPRNCEYFPHVVRGEGSLLSRMWEFTDRACYCPIVYNTLEAWKPEVGFTR